MPQRSKKAKAFQKVKNAHRANANGSPFAGRHGLDFVPFDGIASLGHRRDDRKGFTLKDEARPTERHPTFWTTDQRLRHKTVNFVSAGAIDPLDSETKEEPKEEAVEEPNTADRAFAQMNLDSPKDDVGAAIVFPAPRPYPTVEEEPSPYFIVDTVGDLADSALPFPQVQSTSPAPSNSSEEVILFRGRDRNGAVLAGHPKTHKSQIAPIDEKIKVVEDKIHEKKEQIQEDLNARNCEKDELLENMLRGKSVLPLRPSYGHTGSILIDDDPQNQRPRTARYSRRMSKQDENAILADYVANMDQDGRLFSNNTFRPCELGGTEHDAWQDESEVSPGDLVKDVIELVHGGWNRADIDDLGDLSTSDEAMGNVEKIYDKRQRKSGVQYLVVWENSTIDEARWVPLTTLTAAGALSQIELFEDEERLVSQFRYPQAEEETSGSADADIEDPDDGNDDEAFIQKKIDRMSDEQIARLLTKQEELGMGSDELVLFAGEADPEGTEVLDGVLNPFLLEPSMRHYDRRRARRPRGEFPSAILADSYDGFDVMDFERPSLKQPKGHKGKLAFDLSDSEFEATMQLAFENDRAKKKGRKQEREELRAQGLLGKGNSKPDMKQRYKEGMQIHEVKEEIKAFLITDNTTLALPPMDKADRKLVHELANALALKSKSIGGGKSRFPILTKTQRTPRYLDSKFDAIEARLRRRYLPRMDVGGKKHKGPRGGGGNDAGVSYKDGDIVGGSAPQIGIENRGHAMLAKMGWSTGTALGAIGNKGRLEPVSHIVKTTKAGLG